MVVTDKVYTDFEIFLEDYEIGYKLPGENDLTKLKIALKSQQSLKKSSKTSLVSSLMFWKNTKNKFKKMTDKLDRFYERRRAGQYWDQTNIKWIKNRR